MQARKQIHGLLKTAVAIVTIALLSISVNPGVAQTAPLFHQAVSPNPVPTCRFDASELTVFGMPEQTATINVYDILGQRVFHSTVREQSTARVSFHAEAGLYFVELRDAAGRVLTVMKAVKR